MTRSQLTFTLLNESVIIDTYFLYVFLTKLTTPFNKTKAYNLGIIDENGKILKKRSLLKTQEERRAITQLDILVWNLKKIIERIPFGKSRLAAYAAALFLLKEKNNYGAYETNTLLLVECYSDYAETILFDFKAKAAILKLDEIMTSKYKDLSKLLIEAPANVVGSGNIAGASPGEQPVIRKKDKKLVRRKKHVEAANSKITKKIHKKIK